MPDQQYVSTDPTEGEYLSTDPNAGQPMRTMQGMPSRTWRDRIYMSPSREAELGLAPKPVYDRPDNSILGVPPELALVPGIGVGRAVAGATGATGKLAAGAGAAVMQAAPAIKYEAVKTALESAGMPPALATTIALATSGYSPTARSLPRPRRAPTAKPPVEATPAASPAAPAAPAASAPVAATPPVPPAARTPAQTPPAAPSPTQASPVPAHDTAGRTLHTRWADRTPGQQSVQSVRNDVGIAAKRAKVELSKAGHQVAEQLVRNGKTPVEAVAEIAGRPAAPAAAQSMPRMRLNADEMKEYARLVKAGKSDVEAKLAIAQQRELVATTGATPLPKARSRVASRQATGKWPSGTP
jgi:hypothetical protein